MSNVGYNYMYMNTKSIFFGGGYYVVGQARVTVIKAPPFFFK